MKILLYLTCLSFSSFYCINAQSIVVGADGSHSIGINNGSTTTVVHSDGTHSVGFNHGSISVGVSPDGTPWIGHNLGFESSGHELEFSHSSLPQSSFFQNQEDTLFTIDSETFADELYKLKILLSWRFIKWKDYRTLKRQNLELESESTFNKANQLFELHKLLDSEKLTAKEYSLRKQEIIQSNCLK